ncbi:MAG: methyltransferase domain-containing protein [Coriobacteriales bacterium]|jgi:ubiquinone/menaquinone biosynthesis C-methylase UbiE|nr:methyltransferase domain-containing protein [Coriobacteriales bacterium]
MSTATDIHNQVSTYYARMQTSAALKTNACCCGTNSQPDYVSAVLPLISDEVLEQFYGCGSPLPPLLQGCTVLDLGCGSGRDSFIAARLVGESGRVIGIDMTPEQIAVARRNEQRQAAAFGYAKPNTEFIDGLIEDLGASGIADNSVDVVISNCVINLSADKEQVFREIYRVLKPNGELFFSDVFANKRMPKQLHDDPVLYGECLAGAFYEEEFRQMLAGGGWSYFNFVNTVEMTVDDPDLAASVKGINFSSRTVRAIKAGVPEWGDGGCDNAATYLGNISDYPVSFDFDQQWRFTAGKSVLVPGNLAAALRNSRYSQAFAVSTATP